MKTINCGDEVMVHGCRCLISQVLIVGGVKSHPLRLGEYGDVFITCKALDRWIHEDELPEEYPYNEMFSKSMIVDGVRMFPEMA